MPSIRITPYQKKPAASVAMHCTSVTLCYTSDQLCWANNNVLSASA